MATTRAQPRKRAARQPQSAPETPPEDAGIPAPADDDQPLPTNVIAALARVQAFIGGVPKMTSADHRKRTGAAPDPEDRGVKYAFRSIDQITARAQPLFGRYGVVIVPRVGSYDQQPIEVAGKPWVEITTTVHWTIFGPGGRDDFIEASTVGVGRDNSDKGANKAMTSAYKNLVLRLLTIGDPDDDPDHEKHDTQSRGQRKPTQAEAENANAAQRVFERVVSAAESYGRELGAFGKEHGGKRFGVEDLLDSEWREAVEAEIDRLEGGGADADALGDALDPSFEFDDGPDPREVK